MIIALDPGGTTGIAYRVTGESVRTLVVFDEYQLYDWIEHRHDTIEQIIVENFVTGGTISSDGLDAVRKVGGILALAYLYGIPVDLRNSNTRYAFIPKAKAHLKETKPNHVIHEVDALAHLLQWEHLQAKGVANPRQQILEKFGQT